MVFTELLEMVEQRFSFDVVDATLARAGSTGSFTAVGNYPDEELIRIVGALSAEVGVPIPDLLHAYGRHLFGRFLSLYPSFFESHTDAVDFLAGLESRVHAEVRKLYPSSRPPLFVLTDVGGGLHHLDYTSDRGMHRLALGLLEATFEHFGGNCSILRTEDLSGGAGTRVRFHLGPAR